jgi:ABC-type multidrug transport system fused ATPase/permease subunit
MARQFGQSIVYAFKLVWSASKKYTLGLLLTSVTASPLTAVNLYISKLIVDKVVDVVKNNAPEQITYLILLVLLEFIVSVCQNALEKLSLMFAKLLGDIFIPKLNDQILRKANELDLSFFETPEFYDSLSRAQQESGFRPIEILQHLIYITQGVFGLGAFVIILWGFSPLAVLALFAGAAISLTTQARLNVWEFFTLNWQIPATRKLQYLFWLLTNNITAKEVRIFGLGDQFREDHLHILQQQNAEKANIARQKTFEGVFTGILGGLIFSVTYGFLIIYAARQQLSVGDLVLFAGAFQQSQISLNYLALGIATIYQAGFFLNNVKRFLQYETKMTSGYLTVKDASLSKGIEVNNVSFAYPSQEQHAIKNVSFEIKPGEVMAIVGENGAGKTTLIKLLCRLYDPIIGEIKLGGISLKDYKLDSLRMMYSATLQDFVQYQATVKENIAYGFEEKKDDMTAIKNIAKEVGADEFINELPKGYDTVLGTWFEGGQELSKGQWQMIALARTLFRPAHIVILDEPTAALSPSAEVRIFQTLRDKLSNNQIGIIVSHRFSTVRLANKIIVLEKGQITEQGSHEELMKLEGMYSRLYKMQASSYLPTEE